MRVMIIDPSVSLLLDAVGLIVAQDGEPAGWPHPADDDLADQVPPAPPYRPGSACGAERSDPPSSGPVAVSKPRSSRLVAMVLDRARRKIGKPNRTAKPATASDDPVVFLAGASPPPPYPSPGGG